MKSLNKYFLYAAIVALVFTSLFLVVHIKTELEGYNRNFPAPTISVSGEGIVFVKPDIATITVGVYREDKNFVLAQSEVTNTMNTVILFLKDSGIEERDQKTITYSIAPRYDSKDKLLGYGVEHILELKIRDLTKVGEIVSGAASRAANRIGSLRFTVENPEKAREEAREKAIGNAKSKAKMLSKQLGARLKKITSYYESEGGFLGPIYLSEAAFGKGGDFSAPAPPIPAGENEIKIVVTVNYEIK